MISKEEYCVTENYTIKEVMQVLENIRERGVIVRNKNNKVVGVLSQGDIIYALAQGHSMYSTIDKIYSSNFIYLTEKNLNKAFEIFKSKNLCLIPIINSDYMLQEVLTARDLLKHTFFEH